jgi:hypothetical protein
MERCAHQRIETRRAQRKAGYWSAYVIAKMYADLGDKEQAFRLLDSFVRSGIRGCLA